MALSIAALQPPKMRPVSVSERCQPGAAMCVCRRTCVGCLVEAGRRRFAKHWLGPDGTAAYVFVRSRELEELEGLLQARVCVCG